MGSLVCALALALGFGLKWLQSNCCGAVGNLVDAETESLTHVSISSFTLSFADLD